MLLQNKESVAMDEFTIKLNHFRPIHSHSLSLPAFTLWTTQVSPVWPIKSHFSCDSPFLFATPFPISSPPKVNGSHWAMLLWNSRVTFSRPITYSCLSAPALTAWIVFSVFSFRISFWPGAFSTRVYRTEGACTKGTSLSFFVDLSFPAIWSSQP